MIRRPGFPLVIALAFVLSTYALPASAHAGRPTAWADSLGVSPVAGDAHRPGRWSLDFGITGNFAVTSFKGTSISATRTTSPRGAWRVGLSYNVSSGTDAFSNATLTDSGSVGVPGRIDMNDAVVLSGTVMRLHRFHPGRRVAAFLGLGPSLAWTRRHDAGSQDPSPTTRFVSDDSFHSVTVAIAADLGVEAVVARDVALFAQYGSSGGYSFSKDRDRFGVIELATGLPVGSIAEITQRTHGWSLTPGPVRFGVSLYL